MGGLTVRIRDDLEVGQSGAVYRSDDAEPAVLKLIMQEDSARGVRYDLLLDLTSGVGFTWPATYLFVVGMNLEPGYQEDFEAWYNSEHLPALAAVPGVTRAMRFRRNLAAPDSRDLYPEYLALYDIVDPGIAGNEAWQAAVNTPWTIRLRPHFQALWRGGYCLQESNS